MRRGFQTGSGNPAELCLSRPGRCLIQPSILIVCLTLCLLTSASLGVALETAPKRYLLVDDRPAALTLKGWEYDSYPLGNGYFGVSVFGGVGEELWQFCEKSLFVRDPDAEEKAWDRIGLSGLIELRLIQPNHDYQRSTGYRRELDLAEAVSRVKYTIDGVTYQREAFTSYPNRCFVAKISASRGGQISFTLKGLHEYVNSQREVEASAHGPTMTLRATTLPFGLRYEVRVAVEAKGGTVRSKSAGSEAEIVVADADEAVIYVTLGTNYRLESSVFLTPAPDKKLGDFKVPSAEIEANLAAAEKSGWTALLARHDADVSRLFNSMTLDLGGAAPAIPTRKLIGLDDNAVAARYLEELYFQFGRYLLIASSRKGTLPANLQGTWNMQRKAPWTGGYWANINIQMNYWPAFSTGLEETFEPYYDFFHAAYPQQKVLAHDVLQKWRGKDIQDVWTAGTGNSPFGVGGPGPTSGAGTGPFVLLPLWDWYAYTGRNDILEKLWPMLVSSSRFLSEALVEQPDGTLLCDPSWSPENRRFSTEPHINRPGTAYDQQLVYENHRMTLEVARLLGKTDPLLITLKRQMDKLSPVLIGASGQIKEFRQENEYGDLGDPHHRHISQLIGLYPGTVITERQEWIDAARVSLNSRGDKSTGWAMAHRLNAWARIKDGDRCHTLLQTLLKTGTLPNLWDTHPPFQIDGNFGGTSGIVEMLLQSHEPFIDLLPALPTAWSSGAFKGIKARGNFSISLEWNHHSPSSVNVLSSLGGKCRLRHKGLGGWHVLSDAGRVDSKWDSATGILQFETVAGKNYSVTSIEFVR